MSLTFCMIIGIGVNDARLVGTQAGAPKDFSSAYVKFHNPYQPCGDIFGFSRVSFLSHRGGRNAGTT